MRSRGRKRCPSRAVQQRRHLGRVFCALMCRCVAAPSESVPEMDILFLIPALHPSPGQTQIYRKISGFLSLLHTFLSFLSRDRSFMELTIRAPCLQTRTHFRQPMHFLWSVFVSDFAEIAPEGQTFAQAPHSEQSLASHRGVRAGFPYCR